MEKVDFFYSLSAYFVCCVSLQEFTPFFEFPFDKSKSYFFIPEPQSILQTQRWSNWLFFLSNIVSSQNKNQQRTRFISFPWQNIINSLQLSACVGGGWAGKRRKLQQISNRFRISPIFSLIYVDWIHHQPPLAPRFLLYNSAPKNNQSTYRLQNKNMCLILQIETIQIHT